MLCRSKITPKVISDLLCHGYAVIDKVFTNEIADSLRNELVEAKKRNLLHKNSTIILMHGKEPKLLEKSGIFEAELSFDESIKVACPTMAKVTNDGSLIEAINQTKNFKLVTAHCKLQYNEGRGSSFPIHTDTEEDIDARCITAIFYLNPSFQSKDGGHLRLYPFPRSPPVDIEPLHNRCVLFSSARLHHRVLPSNAERFCFTIWMSNSSVAPKLPPPPFLL